MRPARTSDYHERQNGEGGTHETYLEKTQHIPLATQELSRPFGLRLCENNLRTLTLPKRNPKAQSAQDNLTIRSGSPAPTAAESRRCDKIGQG